MPTFTAPQTMTLVDLIKTALTKAKGDLRRANCYASRVEKGICSEADTRVAKAKGVVPVDHYAVMIAAKAPVHQTRITELETLLATLTA